MSMPNHLVFVRHGQSEANVVQKHDDHGVAPHVARALFDRPDWQHRLTRPGIEQAKKSGAWINRHIGDLATFDALYVSPFVRTRETAGHLGGSALDGWMIDRRVVERNWGIYGKVSRAAQREQFPLTAAEKTANPWYACPDGGESMDEASKRFRDFKGMLNRRHAGRRVLVVTHGDFMNVARHDIEDMTLEEWKEMDDDPDYRIRNGAVLEYSGTNPEDETDVRSSIHWRRFTFPDAPDQSPDSGKWVELVGHRRYSGAELLAQVEMSPNLIVE